MVDGREMLDFTNKECETFEDKGTIGYPVNVVRRIINKFLKIPEMKGISLVIKICPNKKISGMDFNLLIDEVIQDVGLDLKNFVLSEKEIEEYSFDVVTEYEVYPDEYIEVYDESQEDLGEEVNLENRARDVTIELIPKNQTHLINKTDEIFYLVLKTFNKLITNLSQKIPYTAKFIFEVRYKKGTIRQVKKITEDLNISKDIKVYFREYDDCDKINLIMPFEEINDPNTFREVLKKIK